MWAFLHKWKEHDFDVIIQDVYRRTTWTNSHPLTPSTAQSSRSRSHEALQPRIQTQAMKRANIFWAGKRTHKNKYERRSESSGNTGEHGFMWAYVGSPLPAFLIISRNTHTLREFSPLSLLRQGRGGGEGGGKVLGYGWTNFGRGEGVKKKKKKDKDLQYIRYLSVFLSKICHFSPVFFLRHCLTLPFVNHAITIYFY